MKHLRLTLSVFFCLALLACPAASAAAGVPPKAGLVVIHAPSGPDVSTTSTAWVDVPHLKGNVYLRDTSDLAITVYAEVSTTNHARMFVRALVDGQPCSPGDVVFSAESDFVTAGFTFMKPGVGAGVRTVRIQWLVDPGATAYMGDRTLHIALAQADAEELRLLAVAAPSGPDQVITGGWTDIANLSGTLQLAAPSDLAITLSAECYTTNDKRMFVRALVDGQATAPSDAVLVVGDFTGTRAFTFIAENVGAGSHNVRLQALVDGGGEGHLADRTLQVVAIERAGAKRAGRLMVAAPSGATQTTTSTSWANMPDLNGTLVVPTVGDVAVRFSGEIWASGSGRVFVRALVDGQPTSPDDVLLTTGGFHGVYSFAFVKRNLSRGPHSVQIQWHPDAGTTAYVGDRTLAAYTYARQWPILFVAMESERGEAGYPFGGTFASSVVDVIGGGQRIFKPYVASRMFLDFPSVADYFLENSDSRLCIVPASNAGVLGPYMKQYTEKYYRESVPDPFTAMQVEALTRADQATDFSLYDRDGNGSIAWDEMLYEVVFYQDSSDGFVRSLPAFTTNDGVTLDGSHASHVYTPDFQQTEQIGVFAHELAHVLINAGDMYETGWDPTAPGPYSLMDQHNGHPHLDPYHKLHAGNWYDPITITRDGYYDIPAVEQSPTLIKLRDPSSHPGEYFLVENRQRLSYDQSLPDTGLAIWHIDETRGAENYRTAVEMVPACGPTNPIQWTQYLYDGASSTWGMDFWDNSTGSNARWHDGAPSRIGVWAISASAGTMRAFFDVPGPGILVDVMPTSSPVHSGGEAAFLVRLVNTGPSADTFNLNAIIGGGWANWSQNPVTLASYEERIVTLRASVTWTPGQNQTTFSVVVQSASDPSVVTTHSATLTRAYGSFVPVVVKP